MGRQACFGSQLVSIATFAIPSAHIHTHTHIKLTNIKSTGKRIKMPLLAELAHTQLTGASRSQSAGVTTQQCGHKQFAFDAAVDYTSSAETASNIQLI